MQCVRVRPVEGLGQRRWRNTLAISVAMTIVGVLTAIGIPETAMASVAAGHGLSCGANTWGELGDGTTDPRYILDEIDLPIGTTLTDISAGYQHNLALTSTGAVYAWGNNDYGQLGDGTTTSRETAVQVPIPDDATIVQISAGGWHNLALTNTGILYAWGANWYGALGDGTTTDEVSAVAVQLPLGVSVDSIAAGWLHNLAVTDTGGVIAWGYNSNGELGDDSTTDESTPVDVQLPFGVTVTSVAAGGAHSLAVTSTGDVLGWGDNQYGAVGDDTSTERHVPVAVELPIGVDISAVVAGATHSLALTSTGSALAWGNNYYGQLGDGTTTDRDTPVEVDLPVGVSLASIGGRETSSVAVTTTNSGLAWGRNYFGQLCNDDTSESEILPVEVVLPEDTTIVKIECFFEHTVAITGTPSV